MSLHDRKSRIWNASSFKQSIFHTLCRRILMSMHSMPRVLKFLLQSLLMNFKLNIFIFNSFIYIHYTRKTKFLHINQLNIILIYLNNWFIALHCSGKSIAFMKNYICKKKYCTHVNFFLCSFMFEQVGYVFLTRSTKYTQVYGGTKYTQVYSNNTVTSS